MGTPQTGDAEKGKAEKKTLSTDSKIINVDFVDENIIYQNSPLCIIHLLLRNNPCSYSFKELP